MNARLPLVLALLSACSSSEVWTGRRCAPDERACIGARDSGTRDATSPALRCVPGRYEGSFQMNYRSGPSGVCGVFAALTNSIARGSWSFEIDGLVAGGVMHLEDACLRSQGGPNDAGVTPPIELLFSGDLDCETGELVASVKGTYAATSICDIGIITKDYFFKGVMSGRFDPETQSFVDGHVKWDEPAVLIPPNPGGEGEWNAALNRDAASKRETPAECLNGVTFRDDLFPDAGTP